MRALGSGILLMGRQNPRRAGPAWRDRRRYRAQVRPVVRGGEERRREGDAARWGRGNREREGKERGC
jgi:hypothetical protein